MQKFTVGTRKGLFTTNDFKVALKVLQEDLEIRRKELEEKIKLGEEIKEFEKWSNDEKGEINL